MVIKAPVLSYSLSELHCLFQGNNSYPSYVTFKKWLRNVPDLDFTGKRILTPSQVTVIFNDIGAPEIDKNILSKVPKLSSYFD